MQWCRESEKAFIKALNIEFLTTTGNYTNFQCKRGEIHMLFASRQEEECKKYLELVIRKYNDALVSQGETLFDLNDFPFCIASGSFSVKPNKGVKFKISLSDKILHNLYHMFMNQIFSLEINDMPNCLGLTRDNREKQGYIAGWLFSQEDNHDDLIKEEMIIKLLDKYTFEKKEENAVIKGRWTSYHCIYLRKEGAENAIQKAIQDFPKELLSRYPKSLLMLFYVFYGNLESQEISNECREFIKGWGKEGAIEIYKNTVRFSCNKGLVDKEMKMKRNVVMAIKEINSLYKTRNFISFNQGNNGNLEQVFTFDLSNINAFIHNIPCDIDYVKEVQEAICNQLNGVVTSNCNVFPLSSKRGSLRAHSKSSDVLGITSLKRDSLAKSNDSTLETSASCTNYPGAELLCNSQSFDSVDYYSRPGSSDVVGSKNSKQRLNRIRSCNEDINFHRNLIHSKSSPLPGNTFSKVKVEKGKSLSDHKSNSL